MHSKNPGAKREKTGSVFVNDAVSRRRGGKRYICFGFWYELKLKFDLKKWG